MKHILYSLLLLVLIVFLSCKNRVTADLDVAESLLDQRPDSALLILQNINQTSLNKPCIEARYALLMSKALDKNYIDVQSDSLIIKAVDYYSQHRNARYRMMANYYHGLILYNGGHYSTAIVAFENAERDALLLRDYHYLGLINRNKSNVFSETNNNQEAIIYMQKAIDYFDCADESRYKDNAEWSLAVGYLNNKDYHKADSILSALLLNTKDIGLRYRCTLRKASILAHTDDDSNIAVFNYRQVPKRYFHILDYAYYALSLDQVGQKDSADFWMYEGYSHCRNRADSATIDFIKSKIELRRGYFQEAYHLVNNAALVQDSLTRVLLKQSASIAQRDYYKNESLLQKERLNAVRKIWVLTSLITMLVFALVVLGIMWRGQEKDRMLKDQMAHLAFNKQALDDVYKENAALLGSLFSSRIDHLDALTEQYYRMEDGKQKDAIFREIKECVASIRKNPEAFLSLEKDLDRYCDGIMTKLRAQVPRIKGHNIKIITLFFAGIPDEIIHLLLNTTSTESLRMTRSRFRKEIIAANALDSDVFLKMLAKKKRQQNDQNES